MPAGPFETTNPGWQLRKLGQRLWEWVELQFSGGDDAPTDGPILNIPDWLIQTMFWFTVALLLAWLGWQIYQLIASYFTTQKAQSRSVSHRSGQSPGPPMTAARWWIQSQRLQQAGDYPGACRALYMAMLLHLGDRQLISTEASLTDGEYQQLVQHLPRPHLYQLLIATHEQLYYGDVTISSDLCDRCRRAYQEIVAL